MSSSDEVRLHRSVSLDQMAEFDPNTGLWHSDGTFEVVRFHEVLPTDGRENVTHIALPAAKHAALVRLLREVRGPLSSTCADCDGYGDRESGRPCSTCKRTGVDPRSLAARIDAALAGLGTKHA